ncbi:MAG: von Willebrand factor type A domain-containing protein, partial [Saprospiraceae bacterium]
MKKFLLLFLPLSILLMSMNFTQNLSIEGTVTDENGEPLIGATVIEENTINSTVTDFDGNFKLEVQYLPTRLSVSHTGYEAKTIKVKNQNKPITISLTPEAMLTEEVVVAQSRKKRSSPLGGLFGRTSTMDMANSTVPTAYGMTEPEPHNTEDYALLQENRFLSVHNEPLSTFSIDVDAASYANMRRFLKNGQQPPKDAVRIEEMVNYFNYSYPQPTGDDPFSIVTEISECPWQPEHQLVHIGLQGKKIDTEDLPASNLVFLIDASGSMSAPNKLPLLQSSFKLLTNQMRPQDRVAIVVYAGAAGLVLPSTSGDNRQKILDAINNVYAGGSTAGGAGIQLAYQTAKKHFIKGGNNRVILATDGDFNIGASSDAEMVRMIEKERESGVFLTVLGFGMGNYKDNKMQQLANKGNGNHAYIDDIQEAKKVLVEEFGGTMFTIAKDVKLQIEFNPTQVQGYRLIGYENRLLQNEDFNDDKKDAGELGAGHTVTAMYEIIPAGAKTDWLAEVDDLKYQKTKKTTAAAKNSDEIVNVKLRYKQPDGDVSKKIEQPVLNQSIDLKNTSDNFRFAAAVAEFGMLLRDSEFKQEATYASAEKLAKDAKGKDENGY